MHETGCSGLVHWDDPEGWDTEGGGRGVQDGEHMYTHGDSCQYMAKTTMILKSNYPPMKRIKFLKMGGGLFVVVVLQNIISLFQLSLCYSCYQETMAWS